MYQVTICRAWIQLDYVCSCCRCIRSHVFFIYFCPAFDENIRLLRYWKRGYAIMWSRRPRGGEGREANLARSTNAKVRKKEKALSARALLVHLNLSHGPRPLCVTHVQGYYPRADTLYRRAIAIRLEAPNSERRATLYDKLAELTKKQVKNMGCTIVATFFWPVYRRNYFVTQCFKTTATDSAVSVSLASAHTWLGLLTSGLVGVAWEGSLTTYPSQGGCGKITNAPVRACLREPFALEGNSIFILRREYKRIISRGATTGLQWWERVSTCACDRAVLLRATASPP